MIDRVLVRLLICACCVAPVLLTACGKSADGGGHPRPAAAGDAGRALGDLAPFRGIAQDVATKVRAGDLAAARARIKDLELAWDAAEAGLKPRSPAQWHVVDDALDAALGALRAEHASAADCEARMAALLGVLGTPAALSLRRNGGICIRFCL